MRQILLATLVLAVATPAFAVTMTVDNRSSSTVTSVNSFPVGADGEAVEDNVGGLYEPVAPGASATFEVTSDCGRTLFLVNISAEAAEGELRVEIDTCADQAIRVHD